MPCANSVAGALRFLTELTAKKSVREKYYQHSDFIAEFFCTLSNAGLFYVAFYYHDVATLLAATFSALSHALPLQRLHDLDLLGVVVMLIKATLNRQVFIQKPNTLFWMAGAMSINLFDTYFTRNYFNKVGPSIHVAWHTAAALAIYKFNEAQCELAQSTASVHLNN